MSVIRVPYVCILASRVILRMVPEHFGYNPKSEKNVIKSKSVFLPKSVKIEKSLESMLLCPSVFLFSFIFDGSGKHRLSLFFTFFPQQVATAPPQLLDATRTFIKMDRRLAAGGGGTAAVKDEKIEETEQSSSDDDDNDDHTDPGKNDFPEVAAAFCRFVDHDPEFRDRISA